MEIEKSLKWCRQTPDPDQNLFLSFSLLWSTHSNQYWGTKRNKWTSLSSICNKSFSLLHGCINNWETKVHQGVNEAHIWKKPLKKKSRTLKQQYYTTFSQSISKRRKEYRVVGREFNLNKCNTDRPQRTQSTGRALYTSPRQNKQTVAYSKAILHVLCILSN